MKEPRTARKTRGHNTRTRIQLLIGMVALIASATAGACSMDADSPAVPEPAANALNGTSNPSSGAPLAAAVDVTVTDHRTQAATPLTHVTAQNASSFQLPPGQGEAWGWHDEHDDLGTDRAVVTWELLGSGNHSVSQLYQLVATGDITLVMNGRRLIRGSAYGPDVDYTTSLSAPNCPQGSVCFTTTIYRRGWGIPFAWGTNIKTINLDFGDIVYQPAIELFVVPRAVSSSYFVTHMAPTFKDLACSFCHSMGTVSEVLTEHEQSLSPADLAQLELYDFALENSPMLPGKRVACANGCHGDQIDPVPGVTFTDTAWATPADNMGLGWDAMTPSAICKKVTSNLPTGQALTTHFHEDGRQAWALESGEVMGVQVTQTAPPHNYFDWLDIVDPWIAAGAPCPTESSGLGPDSWLPTCNGLHPAYSEEWWVCLNGLTTL